MMHKIQTIRLNTLLIAACTMSLALALQPIAAAADSGMRSMHHNWEGGGANYHDLVQGSHVEGHIAFLKAELGITPAQESMWAPVASAMREDVRNFQEARSKAKQKQMPENAIEHLENRVVFANLRAQGETRFLNAFRPLYNSLSPQQKQTADDLLMPGAQE
jgi:hypothetical protein